MHTHTPAPSLSLFFFPFPQGIDDDENTGLLSRLKALGCPDPGDVAATLQVLKGASSGSAILPVDQASGVQPVTTAHAAEAVLLALAVGATALSQRAAAARLELKVSESSRGG